MAPVECTSLAEWRIARLELLRMEKAHLRSADALARARQTLPGLRVEKSYRFTGKDGTATLQDLFQDCRQLIVYHAMFDPDWTEPCSSCAFVIDQLPRYQEFLQQRNTRLILFSRAKYETIAAFRPVMDCVIPWYSSYGSQFNYDYHVTLDETVTPVEYNFSSKAELETKLLAHLAHGEQQGLSVFWKGDNGEILHTYSTSGRGIDTFLTSHSLLDLTPMGRQYAPSRAAHGQTAPGSGKIYVRQALSQAE